MAVPVSSLETGPGRAAAVPADAQLWAAPRPRRPVPGGLAGRIDRLARRAHAFHRFAHHPLCSHYAGELIQLSGRRRVCRGCCNALLGAFAGLSGGVLLPLPAAGRAVAALLACAAIAGTLLYVRWARGRTLLLGRRASKLWTRALPAFAVSAVLGTLLRAPNALDACLATLLIACGAALRAAYVRRGPDRTPCTVCPERDHSPCSGYRPIVRAERAFARRAGRLLDGALRAQFVVSLDDESRRRLAAPHDRDARPRVSAR